MSRGTPVADAPLFRAVFPATKWRTSWALGPYVRQGDAKAALEREVYYNGASRKGARIERTATVWAPIEEAAE